MRFGDTIVVRVAAFRVLGTTPGIGTARSATDITSLFTEGDPHSISVPWAQARIVFQLAQPVGQAETVAHRAKEAVPGLGESRAVDQDAIELDHLATAAGLDGGNELGLNMADEAEARGLRIDADGLSAALGVPVRATVATRGTGVDELRRAVREARTPSNHLPLPAEVGGVDPSATGGTG